MNHNSSSNNRYYDDYALPANLISLPMNAFDVILGMNWLTGPNNLTNQQRVFKAWKISMTGPE